MRLIKSRSLYIKTANVVNGLPYDFTIEMPVGSLTCGANEVMRVGLAQWSVYLGWSNVTSANNVIQLAGVTVTIPVGNYTYTTLAETITELYVAAAPEAAPTLLVAYLAPSNHFAFTFSSSAAIVFPSDSWSILGFSSATTRYGAYIESDAPVKPRLVDNIKVAIRGVTPTNYAYEIAEDGTVRSVDFVANVPITAPPYSLNVWRSLIDGDAAVMVADKDIRELRVIMYQERDDELATFLPHSELELRVDTFVVNESAAQLAELSKIGEYSRLQFLQAGLAGGN